ncbi:MAG: hypothetical protein CL910_06870 [Deltaproteobacteria bacterium]|jgi:hypothetical protein|nr:hypothetical protein [Deltaproteobacteria bacterium]
MRRVFLLIPALVLLLGLPVLAEDTNTHDMVETPGGDMGDGGEPIDYCRETCESLYGTTQGREYIDCLRRCVIGDASTAAPGTRKQPPARMKARDGTKTNAVDKATPLLKPASPKRAVRPKR